MRGRKPKPGALRAIDGGANHRPINTQEPKPEAPGTTPPPPDWLGDYGREFWEWQAPIRHKAGLLTLADMPAFTILATEWDIYRRAAKRITKRLTHRTPNNGRSARPEVAIRNGAAANFMKLDAEFGGTPASRVRLKADPHHAHSDPVGEFQKARPKRPA